MPLKDQNINFQEYVNAAIHDAMGLDGNPSDDKVFEKYVSNYVRSTLDSCIRDAIERHLGIDNNNYRNGRLRSGGKIEKILANHVDQDLKNYFESRHGLIDSILEKSIKNDKYLTEIIKNYIADFSTGSIIKDKVRNAIAQKVQYIVDEKLTNIEKEIESAIENAITNKSYLTSVLYENG